jgi:DNA-binding response OmpR family regulator
MDRPADLCQKADVIVVDDDSTTGDVICAILNGEGYVTTLYTEAVRALAAIRSSPPRLVIFDWILRGDIGGDMLFHDLRSTADTAAIPILICTTMSNLLEQVPTLQNDHTEVLTKPFELEDLISTVGKLLG